MIALARISAKTGDIEGTGRWLSKSRDSAPDQILPQVLLAEYYLRQNKLDQAETVVNDLVKTDAGHPSSLALQGQLYMLKKQYNQALKPLQDLVKAAPKAALSHRLLGEAWFAVKDYRKGSESFEKVVSLDPKNLVALNNLAWYYDTINDPKALKYAESAYKLTSDNPAVQDTYGWILVKKGEITKGHGLLEEASNALKGVPEVTYHLAVAKIKLDKAEGKVMLEELLASGKDFEGQADAKKLLESL
jgi:Tfp pilus assembly protein PilF